MEAGVATSLLELAEGLRPRLSASDDAAALEEIDQHHPAMLAALEWFLERGRADEGYRLASALVPFWIATKHIDDGDSWFAQALATSAGSDPHRARALYDHGYLVFWAGRYELAAERFAAAIALAEQQGDHELEALALAGAARVALNADIDEAVRLLRRAIATTEGMPDNPGRSSALHVLGVALQMSGDLDGARRVMAERLAWGRARGNRSVVYIESANLSMVERQLGNLDRADELSRDALRIVRDRRDEMAIPWVVNGLAAVTAGKTELERAAVLVGIAESLLERAGGEWPPDERVQYEGTLDVLKAGLAADALERLRAEGRALGLEAGVAYALGPSRARPGGRSSSVPGP